METFVFNSEHLTYEIAGSPDHSPIIFIHGWGSYRGIWRDVIDALSSQFCCIAIDLLGHGNSDILRQGDYSIPAQARRVLALADHLHVDKFILMGHSMGGKVALFIAAELAPERVIKVIDVAGTIKPLLNPRFAQLIKPACDAGSYIPWIFAIMRPWLKYRRVAWLLGGWRSFHDFDKVAPFYWQDGSQFTYQPGMQITMTASLFQAIQGIDLTPLLPKINCPVLVIFGKQDQVVPILDGELVQRCVPTSRLLIFDDCRHLPFADQPEAFLAAVKEFLD